ncbi:O-antigen ligase family protein [Lutibacter sp. TH_r2]|uniref:O-antigen ligase family protein n=1 Tax=Lutibacter sp. TH_r2 TaxID=3082083 RepID=UPI00295497E3|nr:O-antigen ligase family protein [Lutibacter sp. TH_r2]MDV7187458.1 O-antigen ligase family protein [Lutibacter sp. TH_r2]
MSNKARFILSLSHLFLGVLLLSPFVGKIYSALVVVFGILIIIRKKNENNEAILFSAYLVGAEVLFRMSGGMVFHELPKYSVLIFLAIGLYVEKKSHHISVSYVIYILLLLIGIAFTDIPFNESIRKAIAFNLSGPVLLGLSAIYFYKRNLSLSMLFKLLFFMGLPILSMLSLLYFKTPDIEKIRFGGVANFAASGGYGPNQVATILGMGVFIFSVYLFLKKRFILSFFIDILFFSYLIYRGLLTFSRGGMITAFVAISIFSIFFILSRKDKVNLILKYSGIVFLFVLAIGTYTSIVTNGMLLNRYTNKNASGIVKDDVSAGRLEIAATDLDGFFENPFFGLGVGGSKFYRLDMLDKYAASHNEVSRLVSEHGLIGIFILILLISVPLNHIYQQPYFAIAFLGSFLVFWFLTINHSAMRIAFPAFIYGLSVCNIYLDEEDSLHRE